MRDSRSEPPRKRSLVLAPTSAAVIGLAAGVAMAQTPGPNATPAATGEMAVGFFALPIDNSPGRIVDEVKAGVLAHDINLLTAHRERGADVNLEMLFAPPDLLAVLGSPRPHIGTEINTAGDTSDGYAGLTWGISLIQNLFRPGDYVFAEGSLGAAYQDGYIDSAPPGHKKLGSPVLFRESAEFGYQVTPAISVSTLLDHISNANLGRHNAGITSAGGRLGFKF